MTSAEQTERLAALNQDIARWEQSRDEQDIAELNRILSPTLIFRRADRKVVDKATFMSALQQKERLLGIV